MGWPNWINDHYDLDDDGNFEDENECKRAFDNGDLKSCDGGRFFYDPETNQDYWPDGSKKG